MYGREIEKATCIYCEAKIFLATCGALYDLTTAQNIVMTKNAKIMKDQNVLRFQTFKRKEYRSQE